MNAAPSQSLINLLLESGVPSTEEAAQLTTNLNGGSWVSQVLDSGKVDEQRFLGAIGNFFRVPIVSVDAKKIDRATLSILPSRFVFQHHILPIETKEKSVVLATYDLFNSIGRQLAAQLLKKPAEWVLVPRAQLLRAMKTLYGVGAETFDEILKTRGSMDVLEDVETAIELNADDPEASVVKFVNQIIREAIAERATDIHVEPLENDLRIRYRIDGILHEVAVPPQLRVLQSAIISRLKVMSHMDIAERRLPQDGRMNLLAGNVEIDVRVSTIPTVNGESISLRLLSRGEQQFNFDRLDLGGDNPADEGLPATPQSGLEPDPTSGLKTESDSGDFPVLPKETPCLRIARFELAVPETMSAAARRAGASTLPQDPFAFAAEWLARYNGQCVGQQALNTLIAGLARAIVKRGYLTTRVRIPEQGLSSGVMKIALMPGTIHVVRFTDESTRASWRNAFAGRPGDLLKLSDLEQALVQFEQVPGQTADISIAPAQELGQSDVLVTLTRRRPWRLSAVIDNGGSYATGKVLGTLGASLDNPLGINDRLSASFSHDLMFGQRAQGSYGWSGFYAVPLGYWTTSLSGWGSHYYQRISGHNASFVSSGQSENVEWQLARNILRSRTMTLGLEFRLGKRFGQGFIEDFELKSQRRNNTYVQFGVNHRYYFGAARLDAALSYRQGVPWLGARNDPAGFRATYLYRMGLLDANLRVPFALGTRPFLYTSAFHGQTTGNRLFRVDDIALGTRWSVRGFDGEEILSAERGFYWRNDLAVPLGHSSHALYVGVDYGQLYGPNTHYLRGTRLAGAVLGVRGVAGSQGGASRAAAALPAQSERGMKGAAPATGQAGAVSATAASPGAETGFGFTSASLPGVLTYDLYAGAPVWKPEGFQTANLTVGFQLAYWY